MKFNKNSLAGMIIVLGSVCVVSGVLLGVVYSITQEPIAKAASAKETKAIAAVLPPFDNDPLKDAAKIFTEGDTDETTVFPAYMGTKFVGAAVNCYSMLGFSGRIDIIFGFDSSGSITGYEVMNHSETPGLGAQMSEWFSSKGKGNIIGLNPAATDMTVSKDGGEIDGITAATITSRAFLDALHKAYIAFSDFKNTHNTQSK